MKYCVISTEDREFDILQMKFKSFRRFSVRISKNEALKGLKLKKGI